MVLGYLHSASLKKHTRYLRVRKKLPLCPPTDPTREDKIFAALRRAAPKPRAQEAWKNEWISAAIWRLVNERVSARRDPAKYQTLIRRLDRAIKARMSTDRKRRTEEAGAEVETLVGADPPLIQEAWQQIKGWYKAAVDCAPPPARVTLERITAERVELYSYVPPPGRTSPHPYSRSRWMNRFLRRMRLSGQSIDFARTAPRGRWGCGRSTLNCGSRRR